MIVFFILFIILYVIQVIISVSINVFNNTRQPRCFCDFLKLTFLPYVIVNLKKIQED